MKYSGHRKLLYEFSKLSNLMLLLTFIAPSRHAVTEQSYLTNFLKFFIWKKCDVPKNHSFFVIMLKFTNAYHREKHFKLYSLIICFKKVCQTTPLRYIYIYVSSLCMNKFLKYNDIIHNISVLYLVNL